MSDDEHEEEIEASVEVISPNNLIINMFYSSMSTGKTIKIIEVPEIIKV